MIECQPKSLCSGDFSVNGLDSGTAFVEFAWFTEEGRIAVAHTDYAIRKHGWFSGRWTLEQGTHVVAEAHKPSAMFRSFEIVSNAGSFTLQARSPFSRTFDITAGQEPVGSIQPVHAFTRRATIQCAGNIPGHLQLFAFWLVALTWRRSAASSSGGG